MVEVICTTDGSVLAASASIVGFSGSIEADWVDSQMAIVVRQAATEGVAVRLRFHLLGAAKLYAFQIVSVIPHTPPPPERISPRSCTAAAAPHHQGQINACIVQAVAPETIVDLSGYRDNIRYFSIVERTPNRLVFAARGGHGGPIPSRDAYNVQLIDMDAGSTLIINDRGFAANPFVRKFGSKYYAFGGEYVDDSNDEWDPNDPRDGIHVAESDSLDAVRRGSWMSPQHGWWFDQHGGWKVSKDHWVLDGYHGGRISAREDGDLMMFDGKISAVQKDGQWLVFVRANLKRRGGRYVAVAKTHAPGGHPQPWGTDATNNFDDYGTFQLLDIEHYDRDGPANVYFAAVDLHPLDTGMLLGLFPVNLGQQGEANGDGESFIALSVSCDGVHWSELTKLVWTVGLEGRTYDHPVDGLLWEADTSGSGVVSFLVQTDVPEISPRSQMAQGTCNSKIVKYRLDTGALRDLTTAAARRLVGCT